MSATDSESKNKLAAHGGRDPRLVRRLAPRARWKNLDGPPHQGKSPVWEHPNGARLHAGGTLRLPDQKTFVMYMHMDQWPIYRIAKQMQPRQIRALMVWAEITMSQPNDPMEQPGPSPTPDSTDK